MIGEFQIDALPISKVLQVRDVLPWDGQRTRRASKVEIDNRVGCDWLEKS